MNQPSHRIGDPKLASRLAQELEGEVLFDPASRGRYSTDASIYQIEPIGVVVPRSTEDVARALEIAAHDDIPVLPRGAGTSQGGQAVGRALVVDTSKYLNRILELDPIDATVRVEPGVVLDQLNNFLKPHRLFFPVDVATASRATVGGMAGNNSSGARSIRYGLMVDQVRTIEALLTGGERLRFAATQGESKARGKSPGNEAAERRYQELVAQIGALRARETEELERRVPNVLRHIAGYNLHRVPPGGSNLADLLVGSEGTLAFFTELELAVEPLPSHRALGVCHFPTFYQAMDATRHLVELRPTAVELFDRTLLDLGRQQATFRPAIERFVRGQPGALLLVEFSGEEQGVVHRDLRRLDELMSSLGYPESVLEAIEPGFQQEIWTVRRAGLNIMMSMTGDRKPVSFIEDCAVPLQHLAEYTADLNELFRRHGTEGTWYAHASVGCLHVRPLLNLKRDEDLRTMRRLAEGTHALVQKYGGSHSGEHGDGLVRSEFLETLLGSRLARAFTEVKDCFDPAGLLNPGKIVRPSQMDERSLLRFSPAYRPRPLRPALDWSKWGGWLQAVEMCNNNGACRRQDGGVMCPSYRVTRDEEHVTRGRANTLRLALSGQLDSQALLSEAMYRTMDLCIGCKACRRECPTGVDMARMKVEFLHHFRTRHRLSLRDRLIAYLPRYAPLAARLPAVFNLPHHVPHLARLSERVLGLSPRRPLPRFRADVFRGEPHDCPQPAASREQPELLLLADTFSTYFEPENAHAAYRVLTACGYRVKVAQPTDGGRPLCCGRTFLNAGLVDEARQEASRILETLGPHLERGVPIVGLEPSCLLTLRDEIPALLPGEEARSLAARAVLLPELLARGEPAERLRHRLKALPTRRLLVHGHCHEKAFGVGPSLTQVLQLIPNLDVRLIESGCCGMAGSFGYEAEHTELSRKMAELDLLPAIRAAPADAWLVADGTSCRHQIAHLTGREALHLARVLDAALK